MVAITTRSGKGSPLTNVEMDANLTNLRDGIDVDGFTIQQLTDNTVTVLAVGKHYVVNIGAPVVFSPVVNPTPGTRLRISIADGLLTHSLTSLIAGVLIGNYNPYADGAIVLDVIFFTYTLTYLGSNKWSISV